jgi:SRSO17 transposase
LAAYVWRHAHAFIDRALYLPQAWTSDPARMAGGPVPWDTGFATTPALALAMIARARDAGVSFAWVAADSVHGVGAVEMALRRTGKGYVLGVYVLGVGATSQFNSWGAKPPVAGTAAGTANALDPPAWHRLSAGTGAKGERLFGGCSSGPIWNWLISRRPNTTRPCPVFGPGAF